MSEPQRIASLFQELTHAPRKPFLRARGRLDAPCGLGVYIIRDGKDNVVHVGRTPSGKYGIAQRLYNHLHGSSSFTNVHLKGVGRMLRDGYAFQCLEVESSRERTLLEAYAIGCLCPAHLGEGSRMKSNKEVVE